MAFGLILIFLFIIAILSYRLLLYKKDIASIKEEIDYSLNKGLHSSRILTGSSDRNMLELVENINRLLDDRQELDKSYRNKELEIKEMVASISHDLRTPLTSIKGYIDILDTRIDGDKNKDYIDIVKKRIDSLEFLIDSFYELSKLELKEYEYELEYINLEEILLESMLEFYNDFSERGIEPIIDIDQGDNRAIGDMKSMKRIFTNLIDNAIKYSDSYLEIRLKNLEGQINIDFINDTKDLMAKDVDRIFDMFFVLDTSRQSESTGLGLYITRKMLEDMGYSIDGTMEGENLKISIGI